MMWAMPKAPRHFPTLKPAVGSALVAGLLLAVPLGGCEFADAPTAPSATPASGSFEGASASSGAVPPCGELPREVEDTVADILAGGPFAYPDNDNARFGNYEGVLPEQARNYYREYTVDTPGLRHRGARRIVTGGPAPTAPQVWYYTADHYHSFCQIPSHVTER